MARMIPSVLSPEIKSNAEKHIFEWFRDDPETKDWIVLHSLGIVNHNRVIHGETDFFVLVPDMGLFGLEVKGGRVSRKDGVWAFTDRYGNVSTKSRGPFDQAWDGIFSITGDLKNKVDYTHSHLKNVFFGIGVMFPDIEYNTVGCDEEQWQVFDVNDGAHVGRYVRRLFEGSRKRWLDTYGEDVPADRLPTEDDIAYIASLFRGDFDKAVAVSVQIRYSEEALINLTNEQYRCIDQLDDNKRCLINGGAGTGKTLIAIEEAKKAAALGKKVGLFCFNKNLGEWLEEYFKDVPVNLRPDYVGTLHKFMMQLIKRNNVHLQYHEGDDFYKTEMPTVAINCAKKSNDKFDQIIIDEGQDLITDSYLDLFDSSLYGGLTRGRWSIFGDFSQQAIYSPSLNGNDLINKIEERTSFIKFRLTINCRNTKSICEEITMITGFEPPSDVWSKVEGMPVMYLTYSNEEEQKAKLEETLSSLLENHIDLGKITILSPVKREFSIVDMIDEYTIHDFKPYGNNKLSFCTIQSYKGLENTIIILTDIKTISDKKLMYVALSRARSALYVLETDSARKEYVDMQIRRLKDGR